MPVPSKPFGVCRRGALEVLRERTDAGVVKHDHTDVAIRDVQPNEPHYALN